MVGHSSRDAVPPLVVVEPLLPGETICRRYSAAQYRAILAWCAMPLDFTAVPHLLRLLRQEHARAVALQDAELHLHDAANPALPPPVRTRHLLLAGVQVWAAIDWLGATEALQAFLDAWRAAGGG